MRVNLSGLPLPLAAAVFLATAACSPDLFGDIDPDELEYRLRVGLTLEGTPPDTISWYVTVFRIVGADTTQPANPQLLAPFHPAHFEFRILQWGDTDTALICFDVDDPCAVVGDTAQATRLIRGETTEVYFRVLCP